MDERRWGSKSRKLVYIEDLLYSKHLGSALQMHWFKFCYVLFFFKFASHVSWREEIHWKYAIERNKVLFNLSKEKGVVAVGPIRASILIISHNCSSQLIVKKERFICLPNNNICNFFSALGSCQSWRIWADLQSWREGKKFMSTVKDKWHRNSHQLLAPKPHS